MKIKEYIREKTRLVEKELDRLTPKASEYPQVIHSPMRYALKSGKRIRPILCLASAELVGGKTREALKAASAIEMIHTYSLIHDDLPSMDNDDYRRGRPSCHKKFGIANAVLAGDALLTRAFYILSDATAKPSVNARIIKELSAASGTFGMIGGQAVDISKEEKSLLTMEYVNIHKTGALIASSCKVGAIAGGARAKEIKTVFRFGEYIGLVFQIVDDILDGEGMAKACGPKRAHNHAAELTGKAKGCISSFGAKADTLNCLADFILNRKR